LDGKITTIEVQNATCGTYAYAINSSGVIVGTGRYYCTPDAFIRAPDGTVTTFEAPGATGTTANPAFPG